MEIVIDDECVEVLLEVETGLLLGLGEFLYAGELEGDALAERGGGSGGFLDFKLYACVHVDLGL